MKIAIMAISALAMFTASCNNAKPEGSITIGQNMPANNTTAKPDDITDPICGMIKDSTWTDYTVYKGDTVWFCAESEKIAFEGNPKKWEKNLKPRK